MVAKYIAVFSIIVLFVIIIPGCTTTTAGEGCDPLATPISPNQAISGQVPPGERENVYCLYISQDANQLTVELYDLSTDLDLYVGYGSLGSIEGPDDWYSSNEDTIPEIVVFTNLDAGYYYIHVEDCNELGSSFTVRASLD